MNGLTPLKIFHRPSKYETGPLLVRVFFGFSILSKREKASFGAHSTHLVVPLISIFVFGFEQTVTLISREDFEKMAPKSSLLEQAQPPPPPPPSLQVSSMPRRGGRGKKHEVCSFVHIAAVADQTSVT